MKRFIKTLLHNLLLAFLAFVWLVPIVWLVVTSFSAYTGMNTSTFFPKEWSLAPVSYTHLLYAFPMSAGAVPVHSSAAVIIQCSSEACTIEEGSVIPTGSKSHTNLLASLLSCCK